ncbi:MAG TPA: response regulator [Gemmataceae bacterium]|jgi:CheY-like chemotaxis protein
MGTPHANHILVVEDDDLTRDALKTLLEAAGYWVTAAAHGQEALDRLSDGEHPSVILLDLSMPVMDGRTFRKQQLQSPLLAPIPVLLLSAEDNLARTAASLGVAGYFPKPIGIEMLLKAIHSLGGLVS